MQAFTDLSLNGNFSGGEIYGPPASIFMAQVSRVCTLLLEPGFNPYASFHPTNMPSVYSSPAIIGTAAVGKGPWDAIYGPIGVGAAHGNINVPGRVLAPQVGTSSFA
jgi:hypothetical protein